MSYKQALELLKEGNQRFLDGENIHPDDHHEKRLETTHKGQSPFAIIVTCADSRTSPTLIFNAGIGDLFVIRNAGNIACGNTVAAVEFAVNEIGSGLVVVMGHSKCGVVTTAVSGAEVSANQKLLIDAVKPAVETVKAEYPEVSDLKLINLAAKENAKNSVMNILEMSEIIRAKKENDDIDLIAAFYDIETGKVEWL